MIDTPVVSPARVPKVGAHLSADGRSTCFRVWSTRATEVQVCVRGVAHPMTPLGEGVFETGLPVGAGTRYSFMLDGQTTPDPYARFMPDGVHADAEVIDPATYAWQDAAWTGLALHECVFYELHVGTFTPEGTYAAAAQKLPYLKELGVTAVELMPLAAFPGTRGWGYDGVALYAPYAPYGRPDELKAFVDAAHGLGLAVFLDAVYNHFGPDGNFLAAYSPQYFTERFHTPWGGGLDYREPHMRRYVTDNVAMWLSEYHFDGLRLDATQEVHDDSEVHILRELASEVHALGGGHLLLAEDYRNLPSLVTEDGLDGMWVDDFHHSVRVALTHERDGYYGPFAQGAAALAHAITRGWVFEGQEWPLERRPRGQPADALGAERFVYFIQNHDQIGNRAQGDRLDQFPGVTPPAFRGAGALLLTLPMTPLLFMGQEWAASTPFLFFTDHHGELGKLVSEGRAREFGHFAGYDQDVPDPQDPATFERSRLNWAELGQGEHARTLQLYRDLLRLRREDPVLRDARRDAMTAGNDGDLLWVRRADEHGVRVLLWNLGEGRELTKLSLPFDLPSEVLLHTEGRPGSRLEPFEAVLLGGPA